MSKEEEPRGYYLQEKSKLETEIYSVRGKYSKACLSCLWLWIMEKAREFQKNIYFCFSNYAIAFDCVDHNKLWKILKEMGIPDNLTCFLRNPYAGQEAKLELDMEQQTGSK